MILISSPADSRVILNSSLAHSGVILSSSPADNRLILSTSLAHCGAILGSSPDHYGVFLGLLLLSSAQTEVILKCRSLWGDPWLQLNTPWDDLNLSEKVDQVLTNVM